MALPCFSQQASNIVIDGVRVGLREFREDGDSLRITYLVDMNARAIARYQGLNIVLGVEADNESLLLPGVTLVVGPNKRRVLTRYYQNNHLEQPPFDIDWRSDNSFIVRVSIPYRNWMDDARVIVHQEVANYRGRNVFFYYEFFNRVERELIQQREEYQVVPRVTVIAPAGEARDFSVQDAVNVIDSNPGSLSHFQMFQVAETFGRDSECFSQILLETVLRYFPDDEIANLNAAALLIERGDLTAAKRHLEKAGNGEAALNNRGVVALLEGNLDEAGNYFSRAQQAGSPEAAHNRLELDRKREDNRR
jgi:hypothetical protein